eukprot:PLAT10327.1.p1 GENE.PLAT10327.1~~PLAT10327.1.p1  ORF type:complete len:151 (-),score=50.01 PLAT10327.1:50-502(-)
MSTDAPLTLLAGTGRAAAAVHRLPCTIDFSGKAAVSKHFFPDGEPATPLLEEDELAIADSSSVDDDGVKVAAFRGRLLRGRDVSMPAGYTGAVLSSGVDAEGQRAMVVDGSFETFTYWKHDDVPTEADVVPSALRWVTAATVLHSEEADE